MAFSDSAWNFKHPKTLYAWDGACVWIPCTYSSVKGSGHTLDNLTVYHNFTFDKKTKHYNGTILYNKSLKTKESTPRQERVQFLGNNRNNCTLLINPVKVDDSGLLGLRVTSGTDKWMESLDLNISGKALRMGPFVSAGRKWGNIRLLGLITNWVACRGQTGMPESDHGGTRTLWCPWQTGVWAFTPP